MFLFSKVLGDFSQILGSVCVCVAFFLGFGVVVLRFLKPFQTCELG